ncbi:hypothetical protein FRACYDRAFT_233763 [Fragilariopsis cylindrus CCMP1102]|uniref:Saccharopine dehydrogenase NADP binding domain-containing protein n=1 Tax=Fragilariopsis cylindrus CCMP1102 TaxID=635003 RepID=A0A1E7FZL7_9STRA|nr:hypothetical protein FRACYDRAFT_233763 [Fragilariopsis cylindrus CCMP1102]|eukprot:OEU23588.1 hypothetical protein FRACYDRAFT_233763 [Fragilariopsis cylindrus CCMP1102]
MSCVVSVVNGFGLSSSSSSSSFSTTTTTSIRRKRIQVQKRTLLTSLTNNDEDNVFSITALSAGNNDGGDNNDNTGTTPATPTIPPATTVLVVGGSGRVGGSTVRWLQELAGRTENNKLNIKIKVGGRTKKSFEQAKKRGVLPLEMNAEDDFIQLDWAEWNEEQIETAILSSSDSNNNIGLVVHTAGPFQGRTDPTLLRCCIKHNIHYVDVCDEYELAVTSKELFHDDAKQLGITAVVSSGIWPGVSALMAANAVEKLEEQDENKNNENSNKADTIDFSFFTAGTGNAGPTIVSATFLLLATPVLAYRNSKKVELEPWTEKRMINFGKSIQEKSVWLLDNPDVPTTAVSLGSGSSGIPNVSSRFGTDPLPWNYLFGAMKAIPRSILYNREIMQNFALFSEPIIRVVDQMVGSTNAMRVDVSNKDNTKTITSLIVHNDLEMAVGLATAAFAIEVLKSNNKNGDNDDDDEQQEQQQTIPSGVWYPAELPKQARLNILEVVKEGTITYEV